MSVITTVHSHGPCSKYIRTTIPISVATGINVVVGDIIKWSIVDENTMMIVIIRD